MAILISNSIALRAASTLRARLHKEHGAATIALTEENVWNSKESNISQALNFVSKGGELLKRTRKGNYWGVAMFIKAKEIIIKLCNSNIEVDVGDLHWKQVSFNINSNWQVKNKRPW